MILVSDLLELLFINSTAHHPSTSPPLVSSLQTWGHLNPQTCLVSCRQYAEVPSGTVLSGPRSSRGRTCLARCETSEIGSSMCFCKSFVRADLFQVVLRSETTSGRNVEMFGSGLSNNDVLPAVRMRQFEAPPSPSPPSVPPSMSDKWEVLWSAMDVLYGSRRRCRGTSPSWGGTSKAGSSASRHSRRPTLLSWIPSHTETSQYWRGTSHGLRHARGGMQRASIRCANMQ